MTHHVTCRSCGRTFRSRSGMGRPGATVCTMCDLRRRAQDRALRGLALCPACLAAVPDLAAHCLGRRDRAHAVLTVHLS